jgi:hypothetical protein
VIARANATLKATSASPVIGVSDLIVLSVMRWP